MSGSKKILLYPTRYYIVNKLMDNFTGLDADRRLDADENTKCKLVPEIPESVLEKCVQWYGTKPRGTKVIYTPVPDEYKQ